MTEDAELLRRFAADSFQPAFSELVQRHIGFVYAAALRQVHGDTTLAQDVTQQVFIDLARKASVVARHRVLAGWLFTSTRYAAHNAMRGQWRRRAREQATMQDWVETEVPVDWQQLAPVLDEALAALEERDREAVLMRFFEGRTFPEIGARFAVTADAARLRVERALEKMRTVLARHGVRSTAAALALALANQPAVAVPAGLVVAITGAAVLGTAGTALTFLGMTKLQLGLAAALVAAAGAGGVYWQSQASASRDPVVAPMAATPSRDEGEAAIAKGKNASVLATKSAVAPNAPTVSPVVDLSASGPSVAAASKPATPGDNAAPSEIAARRAAQSRRLVLRRYGAFFDEMALPDPQREKMIKLLIDMREATADFAAAKAVGGEDMSEDQELFQKSVSALRGGLYDQIRVLLGEEGYQRFLAADQGAHQSAVIDQMQKLLKDQHATLSPAQSDQLLGVLHELNATYATPGVIERAADFLSPAQLATLQTLQERRQQGVKRENLQKVIHENLPAGAK